MSRAVACGKWKQAGNASLLGLALLLACAGGPAARAAGVVTDCNGSGAGSLAAALSGGGLVTFAVSCTGNSAIPTSLGIGSNTTIDATGQQIVLDGSPDSTVFWVEPGVTLGLTNLTIENGNAALNGGAISNDGGTLLITNCTFLNNSAGNDVPPDGSASGGAIQNEGTLIINNSTFVGNTATGPGADGGAIWNLGSLTVTNSTFVANTAASGGAIYNAGGAVTLENTILAGSGKGGNCAPGVSDDGYNLSDDSSCGFTATGSQKNVTNLNLGSLASNGGPTQTIAPGAGSPAIGAIPAGTKGCATTITTDQRGAARPGNVNGTCTIGAYEYVSPVATTITDCTDDSQLQSAVAAGGRIVFACSGDIPLTSVLTLGFKNPNATLDATGQLVTLDGQNKTEVFTIFGGSLTLNNLTIQNGTFSGGGAIDNEGDTLAITNCTLSNNVASAGGSGYGGAIYNNYGVLAIANSTFLNNSAQGSVAPQGGAIWNAASLAIANSTFVGNSTAGTGGAIFGSNEYALTIINSTFFNNTATSGGGIYDSDESITVENTILAGNSGGDCAVNSGSIIDGGYNMADDNSCGFGATGSQNGVTNLNLGALSYNGGPALTIPLNPGSVALGAVPVGSSGCGGISTTANAIVLTDERGVLRPQLTSASELACDIGAVQSTQNQIPVTFNTNPANLTYSVGPGSYSAQQTLTLPIDTQSILSTAASQTGTGAQYTFASWSDSGAETHQITIVPPATGSLSYTANFNASYLLTTAASPNGSGTANPASGTYYPAGTVVNLNATPNGGYAFSSWTGNVANPNSASTTIAMNGPQNVTANFVVSTVQVTVGTTPSGLSFSVDGMTYTSTQILTWTIGTQHTIATTSPQTASGTMYTFSNWSDNGALSHKVTAPPTTASYTATFSTQYQLTTAVSPSGSGTVTPASGGYYAAGTVVNLKALPNAGYIFKNWTGSVASANSASTTVKMNAPESVTANFTEGPTVLTGVILKKEGPENAREWTFTIINTGPGAANGAGFTSLKLTQTAGKACAPTIETAFPISLGNLKPLAVTNAAVTINFSSCAQNVKFTVAGGLTANQGRALAGILLPGQQP